MSTHQTSAVRSLSPGEQDPDWRQRGACRDEDPRLFHPDGDGAALEFQIKQAKAICRRCPVTGQCLNFALETRDEFGIFGGLTESERREVTRRQQPRRAS